MDKQAFNQLMQQAEEKLSVDQKQLSSHELYSRGWDRIFGRAPAIKPEKKAIKP